MSVSWPNLTTSRSLASTANESPAAASTTTSLIELEPMSIEASFKEVPFCSDPPGWLVWLDSVCLGAVQSCSRCLQPSGPALRALSKHPCADRQRLCERNGKHSAPESRIRPSGDRRLSAFAFDTR